jgi:PleD family two-component response regulator
MASKFGVSGMSGKRVLSIGQCGADHASISNALDRYFAAEVVPAEDWSEALSHLRRTTFDLVLVNRLLDANGSSGLAVIKEFMASEAFHRLPVMLVSNFDDAQREAIQAGAKKGFGKSALSNPATMERLRPFLG